MHDAAGWAQRLRGGARPGPPNAANQPATDEPSSSASWQRSAAGCSQYGAAPSASAGYADPAISGVAGTSASAGALRDADGDTPMPDAAGPPHQYYLQLQRQQPSSSAADTDPGAPSCSTPLRTPASSTSPFTHGHQQHSSAAGTPGALVSPLGPYDHPAITPVHEDQHQHQQPAPFATAAAGFADPATPVSEGTHPETPATPAAPSPGALAAAAAADAAVSEALHDLVTEEVMADFALFDNSQARCLPFVEYRRLHVRCCLSALLMPGAGIS